MMKTLITHFIKGFVSGAIAILAICIPLSIAEGNLVDIAVAHFLLAVMVGGITGLILISI